MKKNKILSLLLVGVLLLQLCTVTIQADETEQTTETTTELTEAPVSLDDIHVPAGMDASVVNGCRTLDGKTPLWDPIQQSLTSEAIMFYEVNSDTVVYSRNPDDIMEPASLVKIMTCLLAVENGNIEDTIVVTDSALSTIDKAFHTLGLQAGEQVTLQQMLYCMMVGSANDATVVIAEHIGGSVPKFVAMMNKRAEDIGCESTYFDNPTGLGGMVNRTTARDMTRIVREAINNELFCEFFSATLYTLPATNMSEERRVQTTNFLMTPGMIAFYEERVTGGRTGITDDQKRCLASTAENSKGLKFITVTLGAVPVLSETGKTTRFGNYEDTRDLLKKAFQDHHIVQVFRETQILDQYPVTNGASHLAVGPSNSVGTFLPSDVTIQDLTIRYVMGSRSVTAPVEVGDEIDSVQLWYKNVCIAQSPLVAKNAVVAHITEEDDSALANTEGLSKALIIIGIILGFVLCVAGILYMVQTARTAAVRAQHRRRRKDRRRSR